MKVKKILFSCLLGMLFCCQPLVAHAHAVGDGGGGANTGGNISGGTTSKPNADSNEKDFRVGSVVFLADFGKFFPVPEAVSVNNVDTWGVQRSYSSVVNAPRISETGRFYLGTPCDILWFNMAKGCYELIPYTSGRIDTPIKAIDGQEITLKTQAGALANGEPWANDAVKVFGDAGGKLDDLVSALLSLQPEIQQKIMTKREGVNVDASVTPEEQVPVALTYDEIQEQLKHYLEWWTAVYNDLGTVEAGVVTPEELMSQFNQVISEASLVKEAYAEDGPGSAGSSVNWQIFADYQYFTPQMAKYPAIGIDYIVYRRYSDEPYYRAMNWEALRAGWGEREAGTGKTFAHGFNMTGNRLYESKGTGQTCMRSPSLMYTNSVIYGKNNFVLGGMPAAPKSAYAGYQFFGYYGALLFGNLDITYVGDPEIPPPEITENEPETETADDVGTFYLMDYEMNHVFDSIAEHYQDSTSHDHARLNSGIWTTNPNVFSDCGHGYNDYGTTQYYDINYAESDGSGKSVAMDNSGPTKLFLHNNGVKGNTWWLRDQIRAGQTVSSQGVSDYVIDYGFNLLRRHFGDARAYSKLIEQDVSKEYLENTLGMYGDIMTKDVKKATPFRDSMAIIGDITGIKDNLGWSAKFQETGDTTRYYTESASHTYYCGDDDCDGHSCSYNKSINDGGIKAFSVHGGTPSTYNVRLISIAHKYQTAELPTGYAAPKDMEPFDFRPATDGEGSNDDSQYRGTNTIDPGITVSYVPEVPMIADEVPGPELEHNPKKVITMGEETRKSKLILMTLYRVTGASNPVKGVVYSDTAVGGDAGLKSQTGNRLALTAGGDFTVKADTNMQVNLYGYALDLIEPGDAGYDAVTLGNDVKAGWGNSGSRNKLMEAYQTWAGAMLNPKNYQADFEMTIGSKKYNSFSATVGSFSSKASQSTETGQYNIAFKHGDIVHDAGYNAFIAQLASDYGCSVGEAEALFEASEMKQAVIKAIEHDNSAINKSAPAKYVGDTFNEPDLSSMLGNSSHWYDEEVRVFVIRRFMTPAARVLNVIAQDKMDIGTSMESLGSDMVGSFNLNVWFDGNCYTRAVEEYRPGASGDNKFSALAAGDLVVSGIYVDGADFNITNATTATGKH